MLSSERGVQQGDPAGPAVFALGMQEDVEDASEEVYQMFPGELEWMGLFLDDVMAAGTARTVRAFVQILADKWEDKGLELVPSKCIVVPAAGGNTEVQPGDFTGMEWNEGGDFKLLGAPFGTKQECESQMAGRVRKAEEVAKGAALLANPQGGLMLVRYCGGFAKVSYVSRTTPPELITEALGESNSILKTTLEEWPRKGSNKGNGSWRG